MKKPTLFSLTFAVVFLTGSFGFSAETNCQKEAGPHHTLYEMVPNIVLPQSIQYKASPISLSKPGAYGPYSPYPATYTAFPSYYLPYPAEMRTIGQTVYPVTPTQETNDSNTLPIAYSFQTSQNSQNVQKSLILYFYLQKQSELPKPALPTKEESDAAEPSGKTATVQQVQYSSQSRTNTLGQPPAPEDVGANYPISTLPASPIPLYSQPQPQYLTQSQQRQQPQLQFQPIPQSVPQQNQTATQEEILQQVQQLLQQNPQLQISAVMVDPNGQVIPLSSGPQQQNTTLQLQQLAQQLQYVQAMNQYVQRISTPQSGYPQPNCGYAPYAQPGQPGQPGTMIQPNPYYNGYNSAMMPTQPGFSYGYGGYGVTTNPYYPQTQQPQQEPTRGEKFRERRRAKEKQASDAWRAPYYPWDTGMRQPAKAAYPWGYFGAQVGPSVSAPFGGYHNMYYGNTVYPGQ
ncbi:MAG: hypothetical protein ACRC10_01890 [Thermoguttaceae bacterium]